MLQFEKIVALCKAVYLCIYLEIKIIKHVKLVISQGLNYALFTLIKPIKRVNRSCYLQSFLLTSKKHILQRRPSMFALFLVTLQPLPSFQHLLKFRPAAQCQAPCRKKETQLELDEKRQTVAKIDFSVSCKFKPKRPTLTDNTSHRGNQAERSALKKSLIFFLKM